MFLDFAMEITEKESIPIVNVDQNMEFEDKIYGKFSFDVANGVVVFKR